MKLTPTRLRIAAVILCMLMLFSLVSCTDGVDTGENDRLSHTFMGHVLADDYDAAYDLVKATVTDADFRAYWENIQTAAEGAESYGMEQISRQSSTSDGLTACTTAYRVQLDNGRIILLRSVTREDIDGIAGIHFSDATEFVHRTDAMIPTAQIIMRVFSVLAFVFVLILFVDCLRRKMKYKLVWVILLFFGFAVTVTVGETSSSSYFIGLMLEASSIQADLGLQAVVVRVMIPVGGVLYLCLRKKFTIDPKESSETPSSAKKREEK